MKPGIDARPTSLRQPEQSAQRCLVRSRILKLSSEDSFPYADLHFDASRNQRWRPQARQDGPASTIIRSAGLRASADLHSKWKCGFQDGEEFSSRVVEENRGEDPQRFRLPSLSHVQSRRRDEQDDCRESFLKRRGIDPARLHVMFL